MWLTRDDLPRTVRADNRDYTIDTDFRTWMKFENIMVDAGIEMDYKLYFMIRGVMNMPDDISEELIQALFSFYRLDKPIRKTSGSKVKIGYRFDYDMGLIVACIPPAVWHQICLPQSCTGGNSKVYLRDLQIRRSSSRW